MPTVQSGDLLRLLTELTKMCRAAFSRPVVSDSLRPMGCRPPASSVHGNCPGENIRVGCHALLQGNLPIQRSSSDLPLCRQAVYLQIDLGSIPGLGRSPGGGGGYPLQHSGLENSADCIVHGVAESWTRLSDFYICFHFQDVHSSAEANPTLLSNYMPKKIWLKNKKDLYRCSF